MSRVGRPPNAGTQLSDTALLNRICERIIDGEPIRKICSGKDMPSVSTFYEEMARNEEFRNAIARAKEIQCDDEVDSLAALADTADPDTVNVVKLQIWARQWRIMKLLPKKYGDSAQTTNISLNQTTNIVQMTEDQRYKLMEKRRQADERLREMKQAKAREIGDSK